MAGRTVRVMAAALGMALGACGGGGGGSSTAVSPERCFPGLITAAYGLGQIVGPPVVAYMLAHSADTQTGFAYGLGVAALALVLGVLLFGWMLWRHPHKR